MPRIVGENGSGRPAVPVWMVLARVALVLGLVLFAAAMLITALLPQGAAFVRLSQVRTYAGPHLVAIALWPAASAAVLGAVAWFASGLGVATVRARHVFIVLAVVAAAGAVVLLDVVHDAEDALYSLDVPFVPGWDYLTQAASWIAWAGVLACGAAVLAALLLAVAVTARREATEAVRKPGSVDTASRRLALAASLAAAVTVLAQTVYAGTWTSSFAVFASERAFGGHAWPFIVITLVGQLAWVAAAAAVALLAKSPRLSWVTWAAAGLCGAALSVKGLARVVNGWTPERLQALLLQAWGSPVKGALGALAERREHVLTLGIAWGATLALAVALLVAAARQRRLEAAPVSRDQAAPQRRGVFVLVCAAVVLALGAPLVASVAVGGNGSLLGFSAGSALRLQTEKPITYTSPTPVSSPSASGGPVVVGVVPGADQAEDGQWTRDLVQVNYEPATADLALSRCKLLIDGIPVAVPAKRVTLTRASGTLMWTLGKTPSDDRHKYTVVFVLADGQRSEWSWSFGR